ncbi:MAG: amidohydrolase family protein [Gammaproteobacteria bacterium]|nr:amidohydrolase family protein [Gammaproteobacteria bacterium]MDH5345320.1 amidohydrolase family protein [Gammaproteobacteria bacterium]
MSVGKIGFEEHFAIPETLGETRAFAGESGRWDEFTREILDLGDTRLACMDAAGIELAVLSLNAPGVQGILDADTAMDVARKGNDRAAAAVQKYPQRYAAFAALPMHYPDAAAAELRRCVQELGFRGCMINGFQQVGDPDNVKYYDLPEYRSFWATVAELDVPFYLHPRMQIPSQARNYDGHPWLMSAPWGFAVETSIHALRLCGSGLFDEFPTLKVCLGHLGEGIPFGLWRIDARMRFSPRGYRGRRPLGDYFRENFHITVSGNFDDAPFRCTLDAVGADRVYYSSDYPFERMQDASDWFDATTVVDDGTRRHIGRDNAIRLLGLDIG